MNSSRRSASDNEERRTPCPTEDPVGGWWSSWTTSSRLPIINYRFQWEKRRRHGGTFPLGFFLSCSCVQRRLQIHIHVGGMDPKRASHYTRRLNGTPLKHNQQQIHQRQIGHSKNRNPHKPPPTQSPIETATKHIGDCGRRGD